MQNANASDKLNSNIENYFKNLSKNCNYMIAPSELANNLLTNPSKIYLLDIRKQSKFNKGHIPTAENCWVYNIKETYHKLPKDKKIVVYCNTGQSANQLVGILQVAGFNVYSLKGGWENGWVPYYTSESEST